VGFAIAGYLSVFGWRSYLLWYVLPVSIVAMATAYLLIPSQQKQLILSKPQTYKASFKEVLCNKSAIACLIGYMFITAAGVWSFYAATFWRKQFLITTQDVAIITVAVVLVYALGGVLGGRLVEKVGRKPLVVSAWLFRGLLIVAIVFMPTFLSALVMSFIATLVGGFAVTAGHNLNLEQAPNARGTMMSLGGVFASVGATLGVSMGALALTTTLGFQALGITLGLFGIVSAIIIYMVAKDPTKNCLTKQ
jgi:predicted MFS family arabinose efflux permease